MRHALKYTLLTGVGAHTFANSEAAALVARFTTPPADARKVLIDNLVGSLKTAGVWSRLDILYLTAAADSQAARQNWIQDLYNLTAVSAPSFTADRGYTGDGASSYLKTGFNPFTAPSPQFTQNDASMSVWAGTDATDSAQNDFGTTASKIISHSTASNMGMRANAAATDLPAVTIATAIGWSCWSRASSANFDASRNGAAPVNTARVSAALTSLGLSVLAVGTDAAGTGAGFSTRRMQALHAGKSLTASQIAAFYTALNTYLQAIGAA